MSDLFLIRFGDGDGDGPSPHEREQARIRPRYVDLVARTAGLAPELAELTVAAIFDHRDSDGRACICGCHPHFSATHDDGFDCRCTWNDERRKREGRRWTAWHDTPAAAELRAAHDAEERAIEAWVAEQPGVTARRTSSACPEQWDGEIDGHSFYFRERHSEWRIATWATPPSPILSSSSTGCASACGPSPARTKARCSTARCAAPGCDGVVRQKLLSDPRGSVPAMTTSMMGPLPAVTGCACRICVPDLSGQNLDSIDRRCIETVVRCGWQVVAVGGDGPCSCCDGPSESGDGPAFAYTVGLGHRAGHPELAMTGLPVGLMQRALNHVADRVVRDGLWVRPGDVIETVLLNAPVTVDAVTDVGLQRIGCASSWFQRTPVEAVQLVWPTTSGVFAWQPGAPPELDELQPPAWRVPSVRTGGLAADPPWPFPAAPDAAAIVCTHLRGDNEPIRSVARTQDVRGGEQWDIHCGRDHGPGIDELLMEHFAHTVRAAPSLREVADLAVGEYAERDDAFSPWRRGRLSLTAE